ncbi:MAG: asparagine synthase (glutamine-hydrolyzing) [bacterium]|nr:asparagine synthase (glutamine-hydrolyzing) [bacterium]
MCGIAGILGLTTDKSEPLINNMIQAIKHRGPDADGLYIDEQVALGHKRLSIIDLSNGANQPFYDQSNNYVIVFNGEIYNYLEVKEKIEYNWKTSSDTEVILAAFIKWREKCLDYLNGMFAFAIWDKTKKELFIARDRIGVKPLYYFQNKELFIFGSEVRSILSTGLVNKKIDQLSLKQYLANLSVKTPRTIIEGVFQLCPGEYAIFKNGEFNKKIYWSITDTKNRDFKPLSYADTVKRTRLLFEEAIQSRMVSDVKVGAFLSGGIDSSAVVALMAQNNPQPVETFSIVFDEKEFDESEYSQLIAKKYNTKHTEFKLKPTDLLDQLPEFISNMDSPTVDGINTYLVSKMVSKTGIKVVLTGIGGDELFVGYKNFKRWKDFSKIKFLFKNPLSNLLFNLLSKVFHNRVITKIRNFQSIEGDGIKSFYANSRSIFLNDELKKLFNDHENAPIENWKNLDDNNVKSHPLYSQYTIAELTNYTLDVLLKDTDQMSMAWALEVREPFFDYKFIEFVLSIPDSYKVKGDSPKSLLVEAMGDLLPSDIVNRPKKGFSFPWDKWLRGEMKTYCDNAINQLAGRGLFNSINLLDLWKRFLNNDKSVTWMHVWAFVILEKWLEENNIK